MTTEGFRVKPLGYRAYGSIPHLPGSRRGPADTGVNEGQYRICCERVRDRHDLIIVQEKLDGSNVAAAKVSGQIIALTRAGYLATTSPYEQHHLWAFWVRRNEGRLSEILQEGERLCGEWLAQAHGTRYTLEYPREPFVAFDLMRGQERAPFAEFIERIMGAFCMPPLAHRGGALAVTDVLERLGAGGYGAADPIEGAVWRVERKGKVDFLAKYVRPDKVDGHLLPEMSGNPAVWNWRPVGIDV